MKVHMRSTAFVAGPAFCGQQVARGFPGTTRDWRRVTCKRCQAIRAERTKAGG